MCLMSVCMILCVCDCEQKTHFKPDISTIDTIVCSLNLALSLEQEKKIKRRNKNFYKTAILIHEYMYLIYWKTRKGEVTDLNSTVSDFLINT